MERCVLLILVVAYYLDTSITVTLIKEHAPIPVAGTYKVKSAEENASGDIQETKKINFDFHQQMNRPEFSNCGNVEPHPAADQVYLIEEKERSGQLMPIMEDEHGTYIMNSKDLRAVEHVERLVQIGVDSLKIGAAPNHFIMSPIQHRFTARQ